MKITKEILETEVKYLNTISKATYDLYWAYGKVQLVRIEETGGTSTVSNFGTKSEIFSIITAIEKYAHFEKMEK
jgi:hypothetical protein